MRDADRSENNLSTLERELGEIPGTFSISSKLEMKNMKRISPLLPNEVFAVWVELSTAVKIGTFDKPRNRRCSCVDKDKISQDFRGMRVSMVFYSAHNEIRMLWMDGEIGETLDRIV